jgi:hypothetical protein
VIDPGVRQRDSGRPPRQHPKKVIVWTRACRDHIASQHSFFVLLCDCLFKAILGT